MTNLTAKTPPQSAGNSRKTTTRSKASGLKLDLTRGKPSPAQLELSAGLLSLPGSQDYVAEGGWIAAITAASRGWRKHADSSPG